MSRLCPVQQGRAGWRVKSEQSGDLRRADSLRPSGMNRGPRTAQLCGAAAKMLEFELAATLRDQIIQLRGEKKSGMAPLNRYLKARPLACS